MNQSWLRLSEEKNALDYLRRAKDFLGQVEDDKTAWKWVVLSLHGALYGFAICALKGTTSENVTRDRSNDYLIKFDTAIERCQDSSYMDMTANSKVLELSESQKEAIDNLSNLYRNNIVHYTPKLWAIGIKGLEDMAVEVLDPIEFLALRSGNYIHLDSDQQQEVKSIIDDMQETLRD